MNEIPVGRAGAPLRIHEFAIESSGPQVVDVEAVTIPAGGETCVSGDRDRVACMHAFKGFPFGGAGEDGCSRALGSLFDPEFEQGEFIGVEVDRVGLVLRRRHEFLLEVCGGEKDQALHGFSRNKSRAAIAADKHCLR